MEKERRVKVLSVIALIVAVLGLTIAFASLSETLKINGTAEMNPVNWDIHFATLSDLGGEGDQIFYLSGTKGDAKINKLPTIDDKGLSLTGIDVSISKPGDGFYYGAYIVNFGDVDAELRDIIINGISFAELEQLCSDESNEEKCEAMYINLYKSIYIEADWNGDGKTTDDEIEMSLNNIDFYPILSGYQPFQTGSFTARFDSFDLGHILTKNYMNAIPAGMAVEYNSDSTELPKGNIKIRCDVKYVFTQA